MNDIIDEVKSELQQENISKLILKYGKHVLIGAFLVLIAVGAFVYTSHKKISTQEDLSKSYSVFQKSGNTTLPNSIKDSNPNIYQDLALINTAISLKNSKQYTESINKFFEVMDEAQSKELRNLAAIHASFIILQQELSSSKDILLSKIKAPIKKDEPFGDLLSWCSYQLKIMGSSTENRKEVLKAIENSEAKSQNIKLINDILINSIKNK